MAKSRTYNMIMKICDIYQIPRTKIMQIFYTEDKICENSELNKRKKITKKKKTINKG